MEATVRYIPSDITIVEGKTIAGGNKVALCFRGKDHALGIINDECEITPVELSLRTHDKSPLVMINSKADEEYPVSRFITHLQRIMQDKPISSDALKLINEWPNNPEDFDSEPIPDHPVVKAFRAQKKRVANCIPSLASEFKTTPQKIRKFLRSNGMHAPYSDEKKIRSLMKTYSTS